MDAFLAKSRSQRSVLCEQAGDQLGIAPGAVEKDFWVCWILRELFRLDVGPHLAFKGGTSLSKCWGIIERFSEDIDLVVDRSFLGFGGNASPEAAPGRRERDRRVDNLVAACRRYIGESLLPSLRAEVSARIGEDRAGALVLDPDDPDQQAILFSYEPVFETHAYMRPVVKIELGARSDVEPNQRPIVKPYLASVSGHDLGECSFEVRAVAAERTFWEKVSLLHEETYRTTEPRARLSRHYYDIWCLDQKGVADRALAAPGLFERVVEHRRSFFRLGGPAQLELLIGSVRLVPAEERMRAWEADYDALREAIFFGEPPTFATITVAMRLLEQRINQLPALRTNG